MLRRAKRLEKHGLAFKDLPFLTILVGIHKIGEAIRGQHVTLPEGSQEANTSSKVFLRRGFHLDRHVLLRTLDDNLLMVTKDDVVVVMSIFGL
jgi:hypothetical protein